jgi:DNA-binding transcriptional MocR family regulator
MRSVNGHHLTKLLGAWNAAADHSPTYVRLAASIRMLLMDGRLPLATRLPGERELAGTLGVSRTTITAAYGTLREDGYAESRQGSGTWTTLPPSPVKHGGTMPFAPAPEDTDVIDLAHASPAAPATALREAYEWALSQLPHFVQGHGYSLYGISQLREAIASRYTARGLPTTPDQILVTAGAQHAFSLAMSLIASPGDRALVEHPTYPNALDAMRRAQLRPVPVPLSREGWDVEAVEAALRQTSPRIAYLNPDFQNPTGLLASDTERQTLAAALTKARTRTVIDETLVELNLDGGAMPAPLATYLPANLAITTGTASKTFWGGIRVGWLRADPATVRNLAAIRATVDNASALIEQLAVTHLLGRVDDVLPERRAELAIRRDTIVAALAERLPAWSARVPRGGQVMWYDIGAPVSSALAAAGDRHGIRLAAGPRFGVDGAFERWLRVPFTLPSDVLSDAADRIATAFHSVSAATPDKRGEFIDAFA